MERNLAGNPLREFSELLIDLVRLQWGFAVLVIGAFFRVLVGCVNSSQGGRLDIREVAEWYASSFDALR